MTPEAQSIYEERWQQLVDYLNSWCEATPVEHARIDVALPMPGDQERRVTIFMTPDQWDDMASVRWGDFDLAAQEVRRSLLSLRPGERYLHFGQYELFGSTRPTLS